MKSTPREIHISISGSTATPTQLDAFATHLFAYLAGAFPGSQAFIARRTDLDRPAYAVADDEPAPALALQVHRLYAKFAISAEFATAT